MPRRKKKYTTATPVEPLPITPAPAVEPRYLSMKDAAKYFSMKYFVFYRWAQRAIEDGLLHVDTSTKAWTFDREELDAAWAARAGKAA